MTDRIDALRALEKAVDAGDRWVTWGTKDCPMGLSSLYARNAFNGSLDAAKALHVAMLHERVSKEEMWSNRYGGSVILRDGKTIIGTGTDTDDNPARAWLLAIIRALIAQEDKP